MKTAAQTVFRWKRSRGYLSTMRTASRNPSPPLSLAGYHRRAGQLWRGQHAPEAVIEAVHRAHRIIGGHVWGSCGRCGLFHFREPQRRNQMTATIVAATNTSIVAPMSSPSGNSVTCHPGRHGTPKSQLRGALNRPLGSASPEVRLRLFSTFAAAPSRSARCRSGACRECP
jgi:hypothetical protein